MHIHTVYFWLKDDLTDAQVAAFVEGLESLLTIKPMIAAEIGVPIPSHREVVDSSYDYSLHMQFETTADQDAYQEHPVHAAFVEQHKDKWIRVTVYDCERV